jgi:hypothetical protein
MNKLGFLLLAIFASKGALAAEVGAPFPQLAKTIDTLAVAVAETGAISSLTRELKVNDNSSALYTSLERYTEASVEALSAIYERRALQDLEVRLTSR